MSAAQLPGRVYLVGAGPGSLDLVTLRARELIGEADVIVYDYLCNPDLLRWARPGIEVIYAGKSAAAHTLTQEQINALLVARAHAGRAVVRLKGGDPYVFGRGGEEAQTLAAAGISFEVVPGVSSAVAAPAYAGIPVTHRDHASSVTFVTGHEDPAKPRSSIDWRHLAGLRGTKIFLMGVERLRHIAQRLVEEGADPATPVALVRWGTTARQECLEGDLSSIADLVEKHGFAAPAVTIVGDVVRLRREVNWFEALPLFGRRIVVTRARRQSGDLTARLARLGAEIIEIPTIRIVPVALNARQRDRLAAVPEFFDWIVFASPNAVDFFFAEYFQLHRDIRRLGHVKFAAVGPATAAKLRRLHLDVSLQPAIYTTDKLAEAFSQMDISTQRICLPHGDQADPAFARQLANMAFALDEWIIYKTEPETEDVGDSRGRYLREGADFILFTSASTVENWHRLKLTPGDGARCPRAVSMGPVTSAKLHSFDYPVASEAPAATLDSLVDTVRTLALG